MGSTISKGLRYAKPVLTSSRRFPTKPQDLPHTYTSPQPQSSTPTAFPNTSGSPTTTTTTAAAPQGRDGDGDPTTNTTYNTMLHTLGVVDSALAMSVRTPVTPYPRTSPRTFNPNPAVHILSQRSSISLQQDQDSRNPSLRDSRNWVDTGHIIKILQLRDELGWEEGRIEKELGLKAGLVGRLGRRVAVA